MKIRIDRIACKGHGLCSELVPELISLDEWGFPVVAEGEVPRGLEGHAKRAAGACPTLALALERTAEARELSRRRA